MCAHERHRPLCERLTGTTMKDVHRLREQAGLAMGDAVEALAGAEGLTLTPPDPPRRAER